MTTTFFPLDSLMTTHAPVGMALAVLAGIAFGFVLERAGFGQAPRLAAQFYGDDMTVFKVMFTAIATAALGLAALSGFGLADWEAIATHTASWTWLVPAAVGGLLLGIGFIISGYCPGTSVVATASGNLDGLVTVVGVMLGSVIYAELAPELHDFVTMTEKGWLFLDDLLGVPPAVLAVAVAVVAVLGFIGAEAVERRVGDPAQVDATARGRRPLVATFAGLSVLALAGLAVPPREAPQVARTPEVLDAPALAARVFDEPWSLRILDLRDPEACGEARVPGAECVGPDGLAELGLAYAPATVDLVLVGDGDLAAGDDAGAGPDISPALAFPGRVFVLAGGFPAWKAWALTRPEPPASPAEREAWRLRSGVVAALTGVKQPPPPPVARVAAAPVKTGGGGCQ